MMWPLGFPDRVAEGIRNQVPDPHFTGMSVGIGHRLEIKRGPRDHLAEFQPERGEVLRLDVALKLRHTAHDGGIGRNRPIDRHQFITRLGKTMVIDRDIELAKVCSVGSRRNDERIPHLHRLLENAVRMTADNDVDPRHLLCERHIFRVPAVRGGSRMRETEDDIDVFRFFEDLRDLFRALDRIVEESGRGELDIGRGIFPHQSEDADPEAIAREDDIFMEIVPVERRLAFIAGGRRGEHREIGSDDGREPASPVSGRVQRACEAFEAEIKIVVPERDGIVAHLRHELQLRALGGEQGLEQRPHAEVSPIDEDRAEGITHAFTVDRRCQAGISAAVLPGAIGEENALWKKVRMEIVGKEDSYRR